MQDLEQKARAIARHDALTVAAIAIVAYGMSNLLHEGGGHGGACMLVGGKPLALSSMHFDCDTNGLGAGADQLVAAGGTLVNLAAATVSLRLMRVASSGSVHTRYFLWLLASVNLLQATGYFLFSGVAGIGDWAMIIGGRSPWWLWRLMLAVIGGISYWLALRLSLVALGPFIGGDRNARKGIARTLMLVPYFTGATLYCVSGVFNPAGLALVAVSAAAASLGGTSGFAWGYELLDGDSIPRSTVGPLSITRHYGWVCTAAILAVIFIGVLGPTVRV